MKSRWDPNSWTKAPGAYSQSRITSWWVAALVLCSAPACSPKSAIDDPIVSFKDARRVVVEVDYMPGAEPAVAPLESGLHPWLVFQDNLRRILPPQVEAISKIPQRLDEMGRIEAGPNLSVDDREILTLAKEHRDYDPGPDGTHLHVLFLDAVYRDARGLRPDVRANHIKGHHVIALFGGVGPTATDLEKILEQAALLHEVGHAFGLVGEGVADLHGHTDPDSPGHCTVESCVMSANPRISESVLAFVQGRTNTVPLLFDPLCLGDLDSFYAEHAPED